MPTEGPQTYGDGFFWGFVLGAAIFMLLGVVFSRYMNSMCSFCLERHPKRPKGMTAIEFSQTYCNRNE